MATMPVDANALVVTVQLLNYSNKLSYKINGLNIYTVYKHVRLFDLQKDNAVNIISNYYLVHFLLRLRKKL